MHMLSNLVLAIRGHRANIWCINFDFLSLYEKRYVEGSQKNHLIEIILLSTHYIHMYALVEKKEKNEFEMQPLIWCLAWLRVGTVLKRCQKYD